MIIKGDLDRMAEELGHPGGGLKTMLDAMEVPSHARHLLLQLNTQRTKGFLCDVIIVVQNALFRAHKNILAASSLYLKSLVVHDNLINLDHEMVSPGVFRVILDYIYTGRLNEGDPASPTEPGLGAVLAAANYLQLLDLVALCKKKLKRTGKYPSHPNTSFLPYKVSVAEVAAIGASRRCRVPTPVIQPCFPGAVGNSHTPRPPSLDDLPQHPLQRHVGELYPPIAAQSPQIYPGLPGQPGLRLSTSERICSPIYGLDLTKKSPGSHSQHTPSHLSHPHHPDDESGGGHQSGRDSPMLMPNHSEKMETSSGEHGGPLTPHTMPRSNQPLAPHLPHLQRSGPPSQEAYPCPPSPDTPGDNGDRGRERSSVYRWVKNEPMSYNPEDDEEDEEDDDGGGMGERDKDLHHHHHHQHLNDHKGNDVGYRGGDCDGEDEKSGSGSEETGSSEGRPSPPGGMGRYHMPYEPESFGDNLYVCIPCDKGFPSSEQLNAHVETHTEEDLYSNSELGNSNGKAGTPNSSSGGGIANGPPSLGNSLSYPEGKLGSGQNLPPAVGGLGEMIRPYRCSSCEKSYKDPATLRQHEKTHWLTRPYPCSICGKKFTQRGTMTRHMRSHLGLKPFACDACGMRFTRQYRLTEHMRIHSGEKPYECQVCGGKFAQQRNLISHMKMHSTGASLTADGKLKMDFSEGIYPLTKYTAEHLGLKQEKASELLAQATLLDPKAIESLYPLHKLAAEHLGLMTDKLDVISPPLPLPPPPPPPPPPPTSGDSRTIDRYSPS